MQIMEYSLKSSARTTFVILSTSQYFIFQDFQWITFYYYWLCQWNYFAMILFFKINRFLILIIKVYNGIPCGTSFSLRCSWPDDFNLPESCKKVAFVSNIGIGWSQSWKRVLWLHQRNHLGMAPSFVAVFLIAFCFNIFLCFYTMCQGSD